MKKIMILGAGIYQVPLIKKAKDLGLFTIVVSYPGNYPGFKIADRIYEIDTRDSEAVLNAARAERIDGITTTGTDVAMRTVGTVCDELGLPGISRHAAERLTDKSVMKETFRGKVSSAEHYTAENEQEAVQAAEKIGFPVMVKACDTSGSRGITKVTNAADVGDAFREALRVSRQPYVIVEKFIEGLEIGVDGFVKDGKMLLCLPHNKKTVSRNGVTVPAGHSFPFKGSDETGRRIRREMENMIAASGLNNSAFNSDVILTSDGAVYVLEAGGRCGATGIPELISIYTGMDYYKAILCTAAGEKVDFGTAAQNPAQTPCMSRLLFSDRDGVLRSVNTKELEKVLKDLSLEIDSFSLDVSVGEKISKVRNGTDRFGQVILRTDREETADEAVSRILRCLDF